MTRTTRTDVRFLLALQREQRQLHGSLLLLQKKVAKTYKQSLRTYEKSVALCRAAHHLHELSVTSRTSLKRPSIDILPKTFVADTAEQQTSGPTTVLVQQWENQTALWLESLRCQLIVQLAQFAFFG